MALPDSEQGERRRGDVTPLTRNGAKAVHAAYHPTGGLSSLENADRNNKENESEKNPKACGCCTVVPIALADVNRHFDRIRNGVGLVNGVGGVNEAVVPSVD